MAASFGTATSRIQLALQSTLQYRCEEIARVINELGTKELQNALPLLLADLFGISNASAVLSPSNPPTGVAVPPPGQGVGWGLRTILHSNEFTDYNVLYQFLHPQGPVFNLLYKLMHDCHLKYEFPLHFLPPRVKQMIMTGVVPPFYADKLQLDPQSRVPVCLALNPFELYIFHFAYHLVNPELQRSQCTTWHYADSLYINLVEIYLSELLPCDRSHVVPAVPYVNAIPSYASYSCRRQVPQSPTKTWNTSQLFRQSILQQSNTPGSLHSTQTASTSSSHTEIWRSETVAQVFVDFWLNTGECDTNIYGRATPPRSPLQSQAFMTAEVPSPFKLPLKYPELLPSAEHICVVRNLIKHLHYFSNSEAGDGSAMDELRKVIVPSSQARIYAFLRRTIHRWPLDSSFRFILETWLSYIQPWRYTDHRFRNVFQTGSENEANNLERRSPDHHWLPFIADNLLSYTVIFQEILPRFTRLDLSTPKNSSMLFRVSKVFAQPLLSTFVREIEAALEEPLTGPMRSHMDASESCHHASKWAATVRQQIQDLETPGFQYKPMFGAATRSQVMSVVYVVRQAQVLADATQRSLQREAEMRARAQSVLSRLRDWFLMDSSSADEYSPEERLKVSMYLQSATAQLCSIFRISEAELPEERHPGDVTDTARETCPQTPTTSRATTYSESPSPSLAYLSIKCSPTQWRQRALNITYEGDPDLLPIRSDESAMFVRLLYQASTRLNEIYGQDMIRLYNLNNVWGRVARLLLLPPLRVRRFNKIPGSFSPCVETPLPPRLSLRPFARHVVLVGAAFICGVAALTGVPPLLAFFFIGVMWAVCVFAFALLQPYLWTPRTATRTITLDDSLMDDSVSLGNSSF